MTTYELMDNGQVMKVEHIGTAIQKTHFCMWGEQQQMFDDGLIDRETLDAINALESGA